MLESLLPSAEGVINRGDLYNQIGFAAKAVAIVEKNPDFARKAIDSFAKVRELVQPPSEWWVQGLAESAQIESMVLGRPAQAADYYEQALDHLRRLSPKQQEHWGMIPQYTESLLQRIAVENGRAGRAERAINAARELESLDQREYPMTVHLSEILGILSNEIRPIEVYEYIGDWIAGRRQAGAAARPGVPPEERSKVAQLTSWLADVYRRRGDLERAVFWFEDLMASAEDAAFREENRNLVDMAQSSLRGLYFESDRPDLARTVDERVKQWPRAAAP